MKETKKEICQNNDAFAYYSGGGGIELHHIKHGINDTVYYTAGAWTGRKSYHASRIYYTEKDSYFVYNGYKILLSECVKM